METQPISPPYAVIDGTKIVCLGTPDSKIKLGLIAECSRAYWKEGVPEANAVSIVQKCNAYAELLEAANTGPSVKGQQMKIKEILTQHRRDFEAIFVCEHCGFEKQQRGYDDSYYHHHVIPKMKCAQCGKIAPDTYRPLTTKYPDGQVV